VKKYFVIAGVVVSFLVIAFVSIEMIKRQKAAQYEATAVPYVKMVIPELSKWDPEIIKGYMTAQSLEGTSEEKLVGIVTYLSKLGNLERMEEPEFSQVDVVRTNDYKEKKIITYKVDAQYENGEAVISIGLLDQGGSFRVHNFNFNSEVLK
jgi:hypothetical protein